MQIGRYDEWFVSEVLRKMITYRISLISVDSIIRELTSMMTSKQIKWDFKKKENLEKETNIFLNNICEKALQRNQIGETEENLLLLGMQFWVFVQMFFNNNLQKKETTKNVSCLVSLYSAKYCFNNSDNENGIKFGKVALFISQPSERQYAYNILALCAVESEQYQLAYDVYLAWINKRFPEGCFLLENDDKYLLEQLLQSDEEYFWREKHNEHVAQMYGNFSYVCGAMYDTLEDSFRKRRLMVLAEKFILDAINFDSKSDSYYCSAGTIFLDQKKHIKSLEYYRKYMENTKNSANKLTAMRSIISVYKEMMLECSIPKKVLGEFDEITDQFVEFYKTNLIGNNDKNMKTELNDGSNIYFLLSECQKLSINSKEAKNLIFQISAEVSFFLKRLRHVPLYEHKYDLHLEEFSEEIQIMLKGINSKTYRGPRKNINNSKDIAYYTSMKNLQFLFSEITDPRDNKALLNCLTMMHARYMNDPEEGLILLKQLEKFLPVSPEELRDELYDQKFVFLKSFTSLIDQLNMWTMYGSDKSEGDDCNGCCVCIAPETFDLIIRRVKDDQNNAALPLKFNNDDDFHLYNVAYVDGANVIVNGRKDVYLRKHYLSLRKHMEKLELLIRKGTLQDKKILSSCIVRLLEKLMFLFKDSSYSLEGESRLIITRDIKDRKEIHKTDQSPPRLFINPPYQIFPERIILGPKVEDSDYWIPHLQFELSKIHEKWSEKDIREFRPSVRLSKINIR